LLITVNSASNVDASFRATYLLEPGRYRLEGEAMTSNHVRRASEAVGEVALWTSERTGITRADRTLQGTNLAHEFTVTEKHYVDLVCEYRGPKGKASFLGVAITRLGKGLQLAPASRRGKL
jgi:hypothetical protein